jgi:hypothetical protein
MRHRSPGTGPMPARVAPAGALPTDLDKNLFSNVESGNPGRPLTPTANGRPACRPTAEKPNDGRGIRAIRHNNSRVDAAAPSTESGPGSGRASERLRPHFMSVPAYLPGFPRTIPRSREASAALAAIGPGLAETGSSGPFRLPLDQRPDADEESLHALVDRSLGRVETEEGALWGLIRG